MCITILSLVLDPFNKSNKAIKSIMMPLHSGSTVDVKYLAKAYDDEMLIPLLKSVYRYKTFKEQGTGETSHTESDERGEYDAFEQDENDIDDIFGDETESAEERISENIKSEFSSFRKEKYSFHYSTKEKLSWFKTKEAIFPNISTLARQILRIPGTQIENERVFSLAGRIATPLRNRISTSTINNLIAIAKNYPDFTETELEANSQPRTIEEYADLLTEREEVEKAKGGASNVSVGSKNFNGGSANEPYNSTLVYSLAYEEKSIVLCKNTCHQVGPTCSLPYAINWTLIGINNFRRLKI